VDVADVPALLRLLKRLFVGTPLQSRQLGETLLPKKLALATFSNDALSSVAYAPQEILLVFTVAGTSFLYLSPYVAAAIALLFTIVIASYRQLVRAYPTGGGDYEVATKNISRTAGLVVAAALLTDYILTVAVSVSSGVDYVISIAPRIAPFRVLMAVLVVVFLAAMNLRGIRESGKAFAIPTYAFLGSVLVMLAVGFARVGLGDTPVAASAHYGIQAQKTSLAGLAFAFLLLRAFASGCAALTGVEAIANGVPAFKKPKSRNAATTLALLGTLAVTMFVGIAVLGRLAHVHLVPPERVCSLTHLPVNCHDFAQPPIIAQVTAAVFGGTSNAGFIFIQIATALILFLASNTAFSGFPLLASVLATDRFLPRQLHTRGDRLVFSNGIVILATIAALLILAFGANVTALIQLYILGVFTSFTLGQTGMVRHWNRLLRDEHDPGVRGRMLRSRSINATGAVVAGVVDVIVVITKFTRGAYLAIIIMVVLFLLMRGIRRHYQAVGRELAPGDEPVTLPSRNHALVLVSTLHAPTLRAIAYARATRPSTIEAVTVRVDESDSDELRREWEERGIPVELTVLDSPYREVTRPVLEHIRGIRRDSPRDVVTVFIPEYVVGRWWEQLLHNQSALRLKAALLFQPGVIVASVPYQLRSSEIARRRFRRRRGLPQDDRRGGEGRERGDDRPNDSAGPGDDGAGSVS
jgi:amino acid transporter